MQGSTVRREQIRERRATGYALEAEGRDEFLGSPSQDYIDRRAEPGQVTRNLDRLVRGDTAGHAEHHAAAFPRTSGAQSEFRHL